MTHEEKHYTRYEAAKVFRCSPRTIDRCRAEGKILAVLGPGGRFFMICFSEHEPGTEGPRRVTQGEIREAFRAGWRVDSIRAARFETNRAVGDARAWLASITRLSGADTPTDRPARIPAIH